MQDKLLALMEEYDMIPAGSTVLCAVSGGADSVMLLDRLYHLRAVRDFTLIAAHFDHRLRGEESRRDRDFVRDLVARRYGPMRVVTGEGEKLLPPVELALGEGDVAAEAKRRGAGIEETARAMRYAFLEQTADRLGADRIATAHHADDNGETVLLHLVRGCGPRGLGGIPPRRGRLIRPLLTTTREEIEKYLHLYGLPHVEDSSNHDETYRRNRIRHQVIPLLEELNPGFALRAGETARLLRIDDDYLTARARELLGEGVREGDCLRVEAARVASLPDALAPRAVRLLLEQVQGGEGVTAHRLLSVVALSRGEDPSARVDLPGGLAAWREYGDLVLGPFVPPAAVEEQTVAPPCDLELPNGWHLTCRLTEVWQPEEADGFFWFSCAMLKGTLTLRGRRTGDELTLSGRKRRTVKKMLIDQKIPRAVRESIPVLADESGVLAVAGIGPDSTRPAEAGQPALGVKWTQNETKERKRSHA